MTERWNSFSRTRQDLFGGIDILAISESDTLGIQACAVSSISTRVKKLLELPDMLLWIRGARRLQVWGWGRYSVRRGGPKKWKVRIIELKSSSDGRFIVTEELGELPSLGER